MKYEIWNRKVQVFPLRLVCHTLQPCGHISVSHHACPCKRNAAKRDTDFMLNLPGSGVLCFAPCFLVLGCPDMLLPSIQEPHPAPWCCHVRRTIHFACGSFMQCWPWLYKSNLASQTDKRININWYPCSGFGRLPSCRHTIPWWKLVRASDTNTPE